MRLVDQRLMLVECSLREAGWCDKALSFGGGFYCRALLAKTVPEACSI